MGIAYLIYLNFIIIPDPFHTLEVSAFYRMCTILIGINECLATWIVSCLLSSHNRVYQNFKFFIGFRLCIGL